MPGKKKKFNARFPPARIKKIMQTDEEVGKVAAAVPVIISRALELFVESLLKKAGDVTNSRRARTLTPSHLKLCIMSEKKFEFLQELVAAVPDIGSFDDTDGEYSTPTTPGSVCFPLTFSSPDSGSSVNAEEGVTIYFPKTKGRVLRKHDSLHSTASLPSTVPELCKLQQTAQHSQIPAADEESDDSLKLDIDNNQSGPEETESDEEEIQQRVNDGGISDTSEKLGRIPSKLPGGITLSVGNSASFDGNNVSLPSGMHQVSSSESVGEISNQCISEPVTKQNTKSLSGVPVSVIKSVQSACIVSSRLDPDEDYDA